jgi:phosphohistidine phosphatase SixA
VIGPRRGRSGASWRFRVARAPIAERARVLGHVTTYAALLGLALLLALADTATASEELWALLQKGGQVVMIRHAITTPGVGDPPGMRLDDCSTQRNLTDQGRQDSRRLGEAFRARKIPVGTVLSSPWCRCIETARLAFGVAPETWAPLGNLFGRSELGAGQVREMRARVGDYRGAPNLIMVTHGSTIQALAGINPNTAEMVILTPGGDTRFTVAGRLSVP